VLTEGHGELERFTGVGLPDGPCERRVKVVGLGVQPGDMLAAARPHQGASASVTVGQREGPPPALLLLVQCGGAGTALPMSPDRRRSGVGLV
jgi:hypothetical protein